MSKSNRPGLKLWKPGDPEVEDGNVSNENENDVIDFMSEAFIQEAVKTEENTRKAFLARGTKRKNPPPPPKSASERLEEGLATRIGQENKGFNLLMKMGYKEGTALGKRGQGALDPVNINLGQDRSGLGRISEKREKMEEMMNKRMKCHDNMKEDFANYQKERFADRKYQKELIHARKMIEQLDSQNSKERSRFWIPAPKPSPPDDFPHSLNTGAGVGEEGESEENPPDLQSCLYYLRSVYCYCLYCGIVYADARDLASNCPGVYENDH